MSYHIFMHKVTLTLLLFCSFSLVLSVEICITSGGKRPNEQCKFPFTSYGKTYNACTYDYSYVTESKPWCSTKTDNQGNHINGNWGTCEDTAKCPIPPRDCGTPVGDVRRSNQARVGQLPWMVSLGRYLEDGRWNHDCGGSLITNRHVLSAAHCFPLFERGYKMRLGITKLSKVSSSTEIERTIENVFLHPDYRSQEVYYDVALAMSDTRIDFTPSVLPVCLPFKPVDDEDDLEGSFVTLAGWGQAGERGKGQSDELKVQDIRVNSKELCSKYFSNTNLARFGLNAKRLLRQLSRGFTSDVSCAGNAIKEDGSCFGDSGSPLVRLVSDTAREAFYEQRYIVSAGASCDLQATLYIRVADRKVLTWIQKITDTQPLLMVVGGFNKDEPNGLTRDVELVTTRRNNKCSKRVRPLTSSYINDFGLRVETDADALGMTGQVTHDQILVCGGKNGDDNLDKCWAYNPSENNWITDVPRMLKKRHLAASVINDKGDLWVLGGVDGSEAVDETEVFEFQRNRWRKGRPLPSELRDSGLSSHCAVSINKTHVLMAGGYAADYTITAPSFASSQSIFVPGQALDKAWMYDGYYWVDLPSMSTVRDRPACTLVQLDNGDVNLLIAGGCAGWCARNPPITSAEMFDLKTEEWRKVADLPQPLSSSRMEQLDGLPTIVGGYNGKTQVSDIYQYYANTNQWKPHPTARLRKARSSPAVLQVPASLFNDC